MQSGGAVGPESAACRFGAGEIPASSLGKMLSAQAAVLEHNFSPQVAAQYKHAAELADVTALSRLVAEHPPDFGEHQSIRLPAATVMVTGSIWVRTQPSMAMLAAYDADPVLAAIRRDFTDTSTKSSKYSSPGSRPR
jgi:hypothetical protein